ncbi:MAG TPA: ABC transporter permease [Vicinamibacterales bacterium]|jgi:predicted permease|nr:ABC transporter permease [Vicinamibacterales bacterium]
MNDLRQAFRTLLTQRGFTAVAVLTLACGIGANITLFALLSAFFLQPLPVKEADRLVLVMQRGDVLSVPYGHSYPDYLDYRRSTTVLTDLVAYLPTPAHLSARGQTPERTWVEIVSPNYFALAGVAPAFGTFTRAGEHESRGSPPVVVLSYRYWQRRFGGDPALVGRPITLNGRPFTVIGIAPEAFTGLSWAMAVSGWVPSGAMGGLMNDGDALRENRGAPAFRLMGRLAPGQTLREARAEIELVAKRIAAAYPAEHKNSRVLVIPENRARPDPSIAGVLPIFAAVFAAMAGLVLLIACGNVANLMLSRALSRQRDLVIRAALGASRFQLIRLQISESVVLAALAGAAGLLLARWTGQALAGFAPASDIPINDTHSWDWHVYAFTFVVSAVTSVVAGLWPARNATRFNVVESLKEGAPGAATSRHRLRNLLVIGQVTMSLVVLASAGLFLQSLRRMQQLPLGFEPEGLLMLSVDLGLQQYDAERGRRFLDDLVERAEALPGVQSVAVTVHVPFDYGMQFAEVSTGAPIPGSKDDHFAIAYTAVSPRFFETTGATLTRGRPLGATDDERFRLVAVVNETMARTLWPTEDAIGRRFRFGSDGEWIEVVGIARDGRYLMLGEQPRPYFYLPLSQQYRSPTTIVVRSSLDPSALSGPLQRLLTDMDRDLPIFNVRTMERHIQESVFGLMPLRLGATMAGALGMIGLFLAVMGLYAVVSYAVTRRTREIGVRMALGAGAGDVVRLVVREGMRLSLAGIAIGLALALAVGFVLSRALYGAAAVDAVVIGAIAVLLVGVTGAACYLPARRATRVNPLVALRSE